MTHSAVIEDISTNIHIHGLKMNDYLSRKLHQVITKFKEQSNDIVKVDIRVEELGPAAKNPRKITAIVEFPDISLMATDSGKQWKLIIKQVQQRLIRQMEKREFLLKRPSGRSTVELLASIASP